MVFTIESTVKVSSTLSLYGLATAVALRLLGYGVVGTDVEEDGVPIPFCERHADVIVSAYPEHEVPYSDRLSPAVRRAIRASLLRSYTEALRAFDPRHDIDSRR